MNNYQAVFKRKEIKYLLSEQQLANMMPVILSHMELDDYAHSSISNLYYDTVDDYLIRRSLEKPQYKEKLRLRSYGTPQETSEVYCEIKKKAQGVVYKRRVGMPYAEAMNYLSGKKSESNNQIVKEIDWMLTSYAHLVPKVFLSYERDSWKGKEDPSLRMTLDRNILWRTNCLDLQQGAWGKELLDENQVLMEVKITNAQPVWLANVLSENGVFPASFSKYGSVYKTLLNKQCKENGYA